MEQKLWFLHNWFFLEQILFRDDWFFPRKSPPFEGMISINIQGGAVELHESYRHGYVCQNKWLLILKKSYIFDNSDLSNQQKFWQKLDLFLVSFVTVYIIKSFLLFDWTWFWQSSCIGKKDFVTGCIFDPKSTMAEICGITTDTFQVILAIVDFEPKKHFVTKWILTRFEVDYGATPGSMGRSGQYEPLCWPRTGRGELDLWIFKSVPLKLSFWVPNFSWETCRTSVRNWATVIKDTFKHWTTRFLQLCMLNTSP